MICTKAMVLMSAAIDGELTAKEEQDLLTHLDECAECRAEYQDARNTKVILRERIVRVQAPQTLMDSIINMSIMT
ncbi:MAG: zf-HC2 domain-containing protein [Chlorobiaceae bacterium]|nr:zf-HC2 domain-containing protein [Chlorobiaceae bacterium]